jgi:hypothetical protein
VNKSAPVSVSRNTASIIADPDSASLKRIAWAFGCAKHGSDEEMQLRAILIAKIQQEPQS